MIFNRKNKLSAIFAAAAAGGQTHAGTITGWNTANVDLGDQVTGGEADASAVYDRVLPNPAAQSVRRQTLGPWS